MKDQNNTHSVGNFHSIRFRFSESHLFAPDIRTHKVQFFSIENKNYNKASTGESNKTLKRSYTLITLILNGNFQPYIQLVSPHTKLRIFMRILPYIFRKMYRFGAGSNFGVFLTRIISGFIALGVYRQ